MEHYLGEKLKNLRESRNWSQAELAKRLNKAVSTISGYESDAHAIPLDVLVSISLLFGVSTMNCQIQKQRMSFRFLALRRNSVIS